MLFIYAKSVYNRLIHRKVFLILFAVFVIYVIVTYILTDYNNSSIRDNVESVKLNYNNANKIVRYECLKNPCGGWGDRLKGILGAYAWAVITDRKFEISIKHPCDLNNILTWNQINWYSGNAIERNNITRKEIITIQNFDFHLKLTDLDIFKYYEDADEIIIRNNLDWLYQLSQNELIRKKLEQLGFVPERFKTPYVFKNIYNKLFKLTPAMQQKYETFLKRAKPTPDSQLICAQYRVHYSKKENTAVFWNFIKTKFIKKVESLSLSYKIFFTTDIEDIEKEAKEVFGLSKVITIDGMFSHMDSGPITSSNCSRIEKVILDFHALQNCDMALISDSGFGKLGVWNRDDPGKDLFMFKEIDGKFKFIQVNLDDPDVII